MIFRPRGVEADVAADVDGESRCARARELLREVRRACAVWVDDLGGHALREHVLRCGQRCRRRVAVDVDEAGRDVEAGDVEVERRPLLRQIADARDEAAGDRDVRADARQSGSVEHGAVAQDDIERGSWGLRRRENAAKHDEQTCACGHRIL